MHLVKQLPNCNLVLTPHAQDNQCSPAPMLAVCFFLTYMLICTYLLVQMVIGIIIDNIQEISYQENLPVTHVR